MRQESLVFAFLLVASDFIVVLASRSPVVIPSSGIVVTPKPQIGVCDVRLGIVVPVEASWVVATSPDYGDVNVFENPRFEYGSSGWSLYTPLNKSPLTVQTLDGYAGKSAVMISSGSGYQGGIFQAFEKIPPNTTFHFKAMIKTVDNEAMEAQILYCDVYDENKSWYGGCLVSIKGSWDWNLYERFFTTPNKITTVTVFPALLSNKGEVWIDDAYIDMWPKEIEESKETFVILNWQDLHSVNGSIPPFRSESELERVERWLKTVQKRFWGIIFICEENYRIHIEFDDSIDTTWFGERLLGYPLYLRENPSATQDDWKDEMYLRMIRGFYDYFSPSTKVGITWGITKSNDWDKYYGQPAISFIRQYYDFLVLYPYTVSAEDFLQRTEPYVSLVSDQFPNQAKFWVLTRKWWYNEGLWKPEAVELEIEACLYRGMVIMTYYESDPPLEEIWPIILEALA